MSRDICDREFAIFLMKMALQAAYRTTVSTATVEERQSVALSELVEPQNIKKIRTAKFPKRLAFLIAQRAILKMHREYLPYPVSQLNVKVLDNISDPTTGQKLEALGGGYNEDGTIDVDGVSIDASNTPNVFPLPQLTNFTALIIEIAKTSLPAGTWDIIDMRLGYTDEPMQWDEIAKVKGKTVRQVRHAYKKGLETIKTYLDVYVFNHTPGKRLKLKPVKKF